MRTVPGYGNTGSLREPGVSPEEGIEAGGQTRSFHAPEGGILNCVPHSLPGVPYPHSGNSSLEPPGPLSSLPSPHCNAWDHLPNKLAALKPHHSPCFGEKHNFPIWFFLDHKVVSVQPTHSQGSRPVSTHFQRSFFSLLPASR